MPRCSGTFLLECTRRREEEGDYDGYDRSQCMPTHHVIELESGEGVEAVARQIADEHGMRFMEKVVDDSR